MRSVEHVDVLIVGAGISGIGAAYYLQTRQTGKSFAIVEARGDIGGTWDLFRYPGIRSDSDLHTFSYEFKPWEDEKAIARADPIMAYLRETVAENGIGSKVRFHHKVISAAWSSAKARWTVQVEHTAAGSGFRSAPLVDVSRAGQKQTADHQYPQGEGHSDPHV